MFNTNFIKKLDNQTLSTIHAAQIADLVERRGIKDPKLFEDCLIRIAPEDAMIVDYVLNFREYAAGAFKEYHKIRAAGTTAAPDTTDAERRVGAKAPPGNAAARSQARARHNSKEAPPL